MTPSAFNTVRFPAQRQVHGVLLNARQLAETLSDLLNDTPGGHHPDNIHEVDRQAQMLVAVRKGHVKLNHAGCFDAP